MPDDAYAISDLARLTGLNVRTIRYYIAQGLIPASGESGPGAHYGQGHLDRLRLTKRLQQQHLPLAEIRQRLAALTDADVAGLLETTAEPDTPESSALDYVRTLLGSAAHPAPAIAPSPTLSPPSPVAFSAMSATGAAQEAPGQPPEARRRGARLFREAPAPFSPGMPRMKDVPAPDARTAAAGARAAEARAAEARAAEAKVAGPASIESHVPERSQWERHALGPNIELHVRRPLSRLEQRRVERLITIARQVLKEDGV